MKKARGNSSSEISSETCRPALTPEARQNQMIALAMDCAERQMREGTASSQVITHFLKLGTEKSRVEAEKLKFETELVKAKTESIKATALSGEMYEKAIKAMLVYSGAGEDESDEEKIF